MISAKVIYDTEQEFLGFCVSGHAGYAKVGYDIYCAGVSVLVENFMNSLDKLTSEGYRVEMDESRAVIKFRFREKPQHEGKLLFQSLLMGLEQLEESGAEAYVKLTKYQHMGQGHLKKMV